MANRFLALLQFPSPGACHSPSPTVQLLEGPPCSKEQACHPHEAHSEPSLNTQEAGLSLPGKQGLPKGAALGGCHHIGSWNRLWLWAWQVGIFLASLVRASGPFPPGLGLRPWSSHLLSMSPLFCFLLTLSLSVERTSVFPAGCRHGPHACCGWKGTGRTVGPSRLCPRGLTSLSQAWATAPCSVARSRRD